MFVTKMVCLLLFAIGTIASSCPQLCGTTCTTGSSMCSSCYNSFESNSTLKITSTCPCPTGYYLSTSSNLCEFCPIFCASCINSSTCSSCIPGYEQNNNFNCVPILSNTNGWVGMNMSYDLTESNLTSWNLDGLQLISSASSTIINISQFTPTENYTTYCKLIQDQHFFGINLLGYNSQLFKTIYGLPPHGWAHVKFQFVAVDSWQGDSLILEISSVDTYTLSTFNNPMATFSKTFNSSQRFVDFCGSSVYSDNLGLMDAYFNHNNSMLALRIRTSRLGSTANLQLTFGVRQIFVRVGTCPRNCLTCSSPTICLSCANPYSLINGICVCSTLGSATVNGCQPICDTGYLFNNDKLTCVQCESVLPFCESCQNINNIKSCLSCAAGSFYYSGSCYTICPTGTYPQRNYQYTTTNGTTASQDRCLQCPSGCSTCSAAFCTTCNAGRYYYAGTCPTTCPIGTYVQTGSFGCVSCASGCSTCTELGCTVCAYITGVTFTIVNGVCVPNCVNSTLVSSYESNVCGVICAAGCLVCFGPGTSNCLSCSSGSYLVSYTCKSTCQTGSYPSKNSCLPCQSPCNACLSATSCLTCTLGTFLYQNQCITTCPITTYGNVNTSSCSPCPINCLYCLDGSTCQVCNTVAYLFNSSCVLGQNCVDKYYFDQSYGKCVRCSPNCEQCLQSLCYRCSAGYYMENGLCKTTCSPQKIPILVNSTTLTGECHWKSPLCKKYDTTFLTQTCLQCAYLNPTLVRYAVGNNNVCRFSCPEGFGKTVGSLCVACPSNCVRCDANLKCLSCQYNYVINVATQACVLNYCGDGYFTGSLQCQPCVTGCATCQIDGSCLSCQSGYTLQSTACVDNNCQIKQYYSTNTQQCYSCTSPCLTCTKSATQCTSCQINTTTQKYLQNGVCVQTCQLGSFADTVSLSCRLCDPTCASCTSLTNCLTCATSFYLLDLYSSNNARCVGDCTVGFYINNGKCTLCYQDCQSCFGPTDYQCLTCYPNFYLDDNKCVYFCSASKYIDNFGHCDWCHPSCIECTGPADFQCITCSTGYVFYMNKCYNECPGATYLAIVDQALCEPCQWGCQVCSSPYQCTQCTGGYNLYLGWCYLQCPANTVPSINNNIYTCSSCLTSSADPNCLACDTNRCIQCQIPYYWYPIGVKTAAMTIYCVSVCPTGSYLQSTASYTCVICPNNCLACSAIDACSLCVTGTFLINGICSKYCPAQTYNNGSACLDCPSSAVSCVSSSVSTSCSPSTYLYTNGTTSQCVTACPSGYYPDPTQICLKCLTTCLTCSSQTVCLSCTTSYTLINGTCQNNSPCQIANCLWCYSNACSICKTAYYMLQVDGNVQCVSTCPIGYYVNVNDGNRCRRCNAACVNCTSDTNCSKCVSGLYLIRGLCKAKCPIGYYITSLGQCSSCPIGCRRCVDNKCYVCDSSTSLWNGICVSVCPAGTYQDTSTNRCNNCSVNCTLCTGPTDCFACNYSLYLINSSCSLVCTIGLYPAVVNNVLQCLPCQPPCLSCNSSAAQCVTCLPNYVRVGSTCQNDCPIGMFKRAISEQYDDDSEDWSQLSTACAKCSLRCLQCVRRRDNCQQCATPYVLYQTACVKYCPISTFVENGQCKSCPQFCLVCANSTVCLVCYKSLANYNGTCLNYCPAGNYIAVSTGDSNFTSICRPCNLPCLQCDGADQYKCFSCVANYYLYGVMCLTSCPVGLYPNTFQRTCNVCPFGCFECTSLWTCTACIVNYKLSSTNQCVNPNTPTCSLANCSVCNDGLKCDLCISGYVALQGACVTNCPDGTRLQDRSCLACPTNCLKCTAISCYTCATNYYLFAGNCVTACPVAMLPDNGICKTNPCVSYQNHQNVENCTLCLTPYMLVISPIDYIGRCVSNCPDSTFMGETMCNPCPKGCLNCWSASLCWKCNTGLYLSAGKCVSQCPLGMRLSNDGTQCQLCNSPCSTCFYNNGKEYCASCRQGSGTFLYLGSCVYQCPQGYYAAHSKCLACSSNCATCLSLKTCSTCKSGFFYLPTLAKCATTCPVGTYSSSGICQPCSDSCNRCQSSTNCTQCQLGSILIMTNSLGSCQTDCPDNSYKVLTTSTSDTNSNDYICNSCINPCVTCFNITSCKTCVTGMYLYGVVCVANCPSGYFRHNLSTSFPICDKCDPTCLTCIVSASQCLSCSLGYMLDTVRSTCVQQCTNPQTFLSSDNKCYPCSTQCYSCYDSTATSCLSCKIPFVLLVNKCVIACPSGSYASPTNICLACNLALCTTCSILRDNCTSCYSGQVLQTIAGVGMCVNQCVDGYYLDIVSSICLGCDASCLTCNGPAASNCLSCKGNNVLFIGSPSSQCVSICPTNTTVVIDSWTQIKACQPCPTNCLSCSQVSNSANLACQSCTTGTYLFNGVCVLTCPSGTYPNPPICSPCNSIIGCNSCIINTTRQVQCTQCNYPYIMVTTSFACVLSCPTGTVLDLQGNCSPVPACSTSQWNGNCLSNCPTGTYSTLLSNNTIICQACLSPCAQCSSSTSCNICLDGFYLLTTSPQYNTKIGQCLLVCPVGYYAQNTSCLPCPSSCLSCLLTSSGVVTCSSCSNGLLINGICVSTCPVGYFGSTSSGICLPCASACLTCSSTSTCTQCKNSLYSIPNCNDNSCLGSTYRLNSTTCAPCNTICLTCFGSSDLQCLSCTNSLVLINGECRSSCPIGYVLNNSQCLQCLPHCQNCFANNITTYCSGCLSPYLLSVDQASCILICPSSTYNSGSACLSCNLVNCLSCQLNQSTIICTVCTSSTVLNNGVCVSACPAKKYLLNSICYDCPIECSTCKSTGCTACTTNLAFYQGKCITACPIGTYTSTSSPITCLPCTVSQCTRCTSTTCQQCQLPFVLQANSCLSCMPGFYYTANICQICDNSCLTCSVTSTACKACPAGSYLVATTKICTQQCPAGSFQNTITNTCQSCLTGCVSCDALQCNQCSSGYYQMLVNGTTICQQTCPVGTYLDTTSTTCYVCILPCVTCTSASTCLTCVAQYPYIYQGRCLSICPTGTVASNMVCVPCLSGCKSCSSSINHCEICALNMVSNSDGSCSQPNNTCSNGYYYNVATKACGECFSTCMKCSNGGQGDCLSCFMGSFLVNGVCVSSCQSGSYFSTFSNSCQSCTTVTSKCSLCSQTTCYSCSPGTVLNTVGQCVLSCASNTYISGVQCVPCPTYCATCINSTTCITCIATGGAIMRDNMCYNYCATMQYLSSGTCLPCSSSCLTCIGVASNCTSCSGSSLLQVNYCVPACSLSYYKSDNNCLPCPSTCIKCVSATYCSSCTSGNYLYEGDCLPNCPAGYYKNAVTLTCLACQQPCVNCVSATSCLTCITDFILSGSTCKGNCDPGKYMVKTAVSTCVSCTVTNCQTCNSTNCYSCRSGYYAFGSVNAVTSCVDKCTTGYYVNSVTLFCTPCMAYCTDCNDALTCNLCSSGYIVSPSQTSSNQDQCVTHCRSQYYVGMSSTQAPTCLPCSVNCTICTSSTICTQCFTDNYLLQKTTSTSCTNQCPYSFHNPTKTDGLGICVSCSEHCLICPHDVCTQCSDSTYVVINGICLPYNCQDCKQCDTTNNICKVCDLPYYLFNQGCVLECPTTYFGNNATDTCEKCIENCVVCFDSTTCDTCIKNYVFLNKNGSAACVDWSIATYGQVANISGFTSNVTTIVSKVYVTSSVGPVIAGQMSSTYFNIEFCQFLYFHSSSSSGNSELENFLSSLQSVSLTSSSATANNTAQGRLLVPAEYTSTFLETNAPIFILMGCFLLANLGVFLFQRYVDYCCFSCKRLHFYLSEVCQFMHKRFRWIYFDFCLWVSYLPFLYFSLIQLQNMQFSDFKSGFSCILAVVIICTYPLYPLFICYLLKSNYNSIVLADDRLVEMSLSPYISEVVRPNQTYENPADFKYFTIGNLRLAYYPLKYFRKFIFVVVVVFTPVPVTTLAILICLNIVFIAYMIALKPRTMQFEKIDDTWRIKFYLVGDLIIEFVLLFFEIFMLAYIALNGSQVAAMSIATHFIGFIMANLSLITAIVLNLIAYYQIIKCFYDLYQHLVEKVEEKEKIQAKLDMEEQEYSEQPPQLVHDEKDEKLLGFVPKKSMNDDSLTEENDSGMINRKDLALLRNLNDKELFANNVDPKQFNKRLDGYAIEDEDDLPGLKATSGSSIRKKNGRKRKGVKEDYDNNAHISSEEMMANNSRISNDSSALIVEKGLLKSQDKDKYRRDMETNKIMVEEGVIKQVAKDRFKKQKKNSDFKRQANVGLVDPFIVQENSSTSILNTPENMKKGTDENISAGRFTYRRKHQHQQQAAAIPVGKLTDLQIKDKKQEGILEGHFVDRRDKNKRGIQNNVGEGNTTNHTKPNQIDVKTGQAVTVVHQPKLEIDDFNEFPDVEPPQAKTFEINMRRKAEANKYEKDVEQGIFNMRIGVKNGKEANKAGERQTEEEIIFEAKKNTDRGLEEQGKQGGILEGVIKQKKTDRFRNWKANPKQVAKDINATGVDVVKKTRQDADSPLEAEHIKKSGRFDQDFLNKDSPSPVRAKQPLEKLIRRKFEDDDIEEEPANQARKDQSPKRVPLKGSINLDEAFDQENSRRKQRVEPQGVRNKREAADIVFEEQQVGTRNRRKQYSKEKKKEDLKMNQNDGQNVQDYKEGQRRESKENPIVISLKPPVLFDFNDDDQFNEDEYEKEKKKNKEHVIRKDAPKKKADNEDFEDVTFERPTSKVFRARSRSKDGDLEINNDSDLSGDDDLAKQSRRTRNSAIQRLRKKSTIQVNEKPQDIGDQQIPNSARRSTSKIMKIKNNKSAILNIQDNSQDENIDHIKL